MAWANNNLGLTYNAVVGSLYPGPQGTSFAPSLGFPVTGSGTFCSTMSAHKNHLICFIVDTIFTIPTEIKYLLEQDIDKYPTSVVGMDMVDFYRSSLIGIIHWSIKCFDQIQILFCIM